MMRKFSHVLMIVAVMAVVASAGSVASATTDAYIDDDGTDYAGRIVVITDPRPLTETRCGFTLDKYNDCVIINPGAGPAVRRFVSFIAGSDIRPGDRFRIDAQTHCPGGEKLTLTALGPQNATPLLFTSTAAATVDHTGVITGQQDEDGFADLVLTSKGEKPVFATLLTDEQLEPADRIVDIIELDYDPVTGIALFGAFLQY